MNTYRKTAIIVGILFIVCTVASILSLPFAGSILECPDYLNQARWQLKPDHHRGSARVYLGCGWCRHCHRAVSTFEKVQRSPGARGRRFSGR